MLRYGVLIVIALAGGTAGGVFAFGAVVHRPLIAAIVFTIGAALTVTVVATVARGARGYVTLLSAAVVAVWLGLGVGLAASAVMDQVPSVDAGEVDQEEVPSHLYNLAVSIHPLPDRLLDATNPLPQGRTLPQLRALGDDTYLLALSPQVWHFSPSYREGTYDGSEFPSRDAMEAMRAIAARVRVEDGHVRVLSQTEIPELQRIRGIDLSRDHDSLYATNIADRDGCVTIETYRLDLSTDPLSVTNPQLIMETDPCLDHEPMALHMVGGRVVATDDHTLIVAFGDLNLDGSFQYDEFSPKRPDQLLPPAHYGSVVEIDLGTKDVEFVASGLRNPQGLAFSRATGMIWATDHGPGGGDELNRIEEGADYGWPDVSYGRPYGPPMPDGEWDLDRFGGGHDGFTKPRFAWGTAIAPSQLVVYEGSTDEFPEWEGDLLMGTLRDMSVRRLRLDGDRVVYDQRIPIGRRIRDLVMDETGRLVMTTDTGEIVTVTVASVSR